MITSRALSEHKQRQRLNFLERVKQETHTPKCPTHKEFMEQNQFVPDILLCPVDDCLVVYDKPSKEFRSFRK